MTDERMRALFNLDVTKKFMLELFKFVASFAVLEERLREELAARDKSACLKTTMDICAGLKKIFAGELADGFYSTMQLLRNKEPEEIEMYIADFLVYVAMLTLDIQSALFQHDSTKISEEIKLLADAPAAKLELESDLILALDDTMLYLITLKSYLKETFFKYEDFTSIDETIKFLMERRPALIFLDIDLRKLEMDGFEFCKKIRELGHDAPIVFMTSDASEKNVLRAMEAGAAGFIVKPASQNIVVNTLEKLIGLPPPPPPKEKPRFNTKELPSHLEELNDLPAEKT